MEQLIIHQKIKEIRGVKVILDSDLATLYGVETKRINETVKRNSRRFPEDFMFEMNKEELIDALTKIGSSESESQSKNKQQKKDPSAPGQGGGQGDTPAPKGSNPDQYKNIPGNQS